LTLLFYVDESQDRDHLLHAGVLVDGSAVAAAEKRLDVIARDAASQLGNGDPNAEIHAMDVFNGNKNWVDSPWELRKDVLSGITSLVSECSIEVIARGASLKHFKNKYPSRDPFRWVFSNLLERLNERLKTLDDFGLVIADQTQKYDDALRDDVAMGKHYGTGGYRNQKLDRVLDTCHFVNSSVSRMIQLADTVAMILRRRASLPTEKDERKERLMSSLYASVIAGVPEPTGQFFTIRSDT
jgi:hypothetical protein